MKDIPLVIASSHPERMIWRIPYIGARALRYPPLIPDKELLNIVDALNEIGNLPIEVLQSLELDWTKWVSRRSILYV